MPKAQLRPSGGSPPASSRERVVAWGPRSLPGSQAGASLSVGVQPMCQLGTGKARVTDSSARAWDPQGVQPQAYQGYPKPQPTQSVRCIR